MREEAASRWSRGRPPLKPPRRAHEMPAPHPSRPARPVIRRLGARGERSYSLVSRDDHVQLDFGAGAVVREHHVSQRRAAEPGGVFTLANVDRGALTSVPNDDPDLLSLVKTLAHPIA